MSASAKALIERLISASGAHQDTEWGTQGAIDALEGALARGASITAAFHAALTIAHQSKRLPIRYDDLGRFDQATDMIVYSGETQHLCIRLDTAPQTDALSLSGDVIFLSAHADSFVLSKRDRGEAIIAHYGAQELLAELHLHGSLWNAVFPSHFATIIQTVAVTFSPSANEQLFLTGRHQEQHDPQAKLACFANEYASLQSLTDFCESFAGSPRAPQKLAERIEGDFVFRKFGPARSAVFDFGTAEQPTERDDFVATYKSRDGSERHREFFIQPKEWLDDTDELRLAAFDVLNMLAVRRGKLFRAGFAQRVFNIVFPPFLLQSAADKTAKYALLPCLNLYRGVETGFRRTASFSFILAPIEHRKADNDRECSAREPTLRELYGLRDALSASTLASASTHLGGLFTAHSAAKGYYQDVPDDASLSDLLIAIGSDIARRAYRHDSSTKTQSRIAAMFLPARLESRLTTLLLQVTWTPPHGYGQPWERWLAGQTDRAFSDALYRTLFYKDFLFPETAYASPHAVQLKEFNVGNTLGADMTGMTLFNPQEHLKVCLYPKAFEAYPNYSMMRWAAWQVFIDSALSSLRALIHKFHPLMDRYADLHSIIDTLEQMIREFVEFYDLDIREFFYRKEYEKLRERMQVDADYAQLLAKFSSAKEDELLREQRLINKLIVSLTIATVTITVVSTLASMGHIEAKNYIFISFVAASLFVWLGYVAFDPIKRSYDRLSRLVSAYWRK